MPQSAIQVTYRTGNLSNHLKAAEHHPGSSRGTLNRIARSIAFAYAFTNGRPGSDHLT
jgi:hypothetical protein